MEFGALGLSNNEIGILLYQNGAEKLTKIVKILFEYNIQHIWPKNGHNHFGDLFLLTVAEKMDFHLCHIFLDY